MININVMREAKTLTIPLNGSVTQTLDVAYTTLIGFIIPSAWTAAGLTIEVSHDNITWVQPKDSFGSTVGYYSDITASTAYATDVQSLLPWRYLRLRSGTTATPINQTAARNIVVIKRILA